MGDRYPDTPDTRQAPGAAPDEAPWLLYGILTGAIGAATIAIFFFCLDLAAGQLLRTPSQLGSNLFLGRPEPPVGSASLALVLGYTLVHGFVFVSIGCMATFLFVARRRPASRLGLAALLTVALFACFETIFLGFALTLASGLFEEFGAGVVAAANLAAAAAMALFLAGPALAAISSPPERNTHSADPSGSLRPKSDSTQ